MSKPQFGVLIDRFQPLTRAHLQVIEQAAPHVEQLIVVIGSARQSPSTDAPFTAAERRSMLRSALDELGLKAVITAVPDHHYQKQMWLAELHAAVEQYTMGSADVRLILSEEASELRSQLPEWTPLMIRADTAEQQRQARSALLDSPDGERRSDLMPESTLETARGVMQSERGIWLRREWAQASAEAQRWANTPYPPTFLTTDAVVVRSGHVLVTRRPEHPGQHQLALPGGFLDQRLSLRDSCVQNLMRKTGLGERFEARDWSAYLRSEQLFDHPQRSPRGRTVTQVCAFDLGQGPLPRLPQGSAASWMPLSSALAQPEEWFEDHHAILEATVYGAAFGRPY